MSPPNVHRSVAQLIETLRSEVEGTISTDPVTLALYSTDASMYQIQPLAVLVPKTIEDVRRAVVGAARTGTPVLPRGGASSLAGQTVGRALVIDFTRHLDRILEINAEEGWARVEPGVVLDRLNTAAAEYGLMVGPDPASSNRATLGGMVANNATGTHSILYGSVVDHILETRVILSDGTEAVFGPLDNEGWARAQASEGLKGEIYSKLGVLIEEKAEVVRRDTPRHWRRNSGYRLEHLIDARRRNVAKLLCGSEGTLAVLTEIKIALVERPRRTAVAVVHFRSRLEALKALTTILDTDPAAVELFDGVTIRQARAAPQFAERLTFIEGDPGAVLLTEYYGENEEQLRASIDQLGEALTETQQGYGMVEAMSPQQVGNIWSVRKEALGLIIGVRGDYKPLAFIEDAAVPVEHLADYIERLVDRISATGTELVLYAHASAGCLHVRPFIDIKQSDEIEKMREISIASMKLVREYGGSVSSEHGDGLARSWLNESFLGKDLYATYCAVKRIFDPAGILNPGKIVNAPPMTASLRFGPKYQTLPILHDLDFRDDGGFDRSVELCSGIGTCRKLDVGTMCPSFMVTRDEEHSTRGRANALRAALSGALPRETFTSDRMYEVMDLCIQCKACKAECPSRVDMAKIKTEWLDQYWREHKVPLRTRLFANLPTLSRRLSGRLATAANLAAQNTLSRWTLDRFLGISRQRKLPAFAVESFQDWAARHVSPSEGKPTVVLFPDTFSNYHDTHIGRAAYNVLKSVGYNVVVPEQRLCCGRTMLSKGMVTSAQRVALDAVEVLHPYVAGGHPVVGVEPSCILTFADELSSMLPGDRRAAALSANVSTIERFIAEDRDGLFSRAYWTDEARSVVVHGHCHQKAIEGVSHVATALGMPPQFDVDVLDAGCCGMAGAFGYEKEHLATSFAMAEHRLAPAVRALAGEVLIAASGTSCRTQILDITGRTALHPIEVLERALGNPDQKLTPIPTATSNKPN